MSRFTNRFLQRGSLGHDSLWGSGVEILTVVSQLFSFALLGRSLGPASYGAYVAIFSILGPFTILAGNGVILSMHYQLVHATHRFDATTRSYITIVIGIGTVLAAVGTFAAHHIVPELAWWVALLMYLTELVLSPMFFGGCAIINVKSSYAPSARARAVPLVLRMTLVAALAMGGTLDVPSLAVGSFVLSSVLALVMVRHLRRRFDVRYRPGRARVAHIRSILNFSVGGTALALQNDGDKAVLAANSLSYVNGLYSAAYKVVQLGLVPLNTLLGATHQRFLTYAEEGRGALVRRSAMFSALTAAYGLVFILVIWIGSPLLPVLLGSDFEASSEMLVWLSPLVLLRALSTFPLNGLLGLQRTVARTVLLCVTASLSLALYAWLIPLYTWKGAVIGTMCSEIMMAIGAWTLLVVYQRRADRDIDHPPHMAASVVEV